MEYKSEEDFLKHYDSSKYDSYLVYLMVINQIIEN